MAFNYPDSMIAADQKKIAELAKLLGFITLETSNSGADFHETAVWRVKEALESAIEYGRKTATESTTTRPVMTITETGKKFPITEAHAASMEFEEVLDETVSWYRVRKPEDASGPAQVALSDMLNDMLNQTLAIRGQLARLAKAEK